MWRVWMLFDPRRAVIGVHIFLFILALLIHFVLLSSPRYNWLDTSPAPAIEVSAVEMVDDTFLA